MQSIYDMQTTAVAIYSSSKKRKGSLVWSILIELMTTRLFVMKRALLETQDLLPSETRTTCTVTTL